MATTNLGRVVPLHKGDYSPYAEYELNDIVFFDDDDAGGTYWHYSDEKTVGRAPTDASVWKLIVSSNIFGQDDTIILDGGGAAVRE